MQSEHMTVKARRLYSNLEAPQSPFGLSSERFVSLLRENTFGAGIGNFRYLAVNVSDSVSTQELRPMIHLDSNLTRRSLSLIEIREGSINSVRNFFPKPHSISQQPKS